MWRNSVVVEFLEWLRARNAALPAGRQLSASAGFYGMDMYSLHSSGGFLGGNTEREQ